MGQGIGKLMGAVGMSEGSLSGKLLTSSPAFSCLPEGLQPEGWAEGPPRQLMAGCNCRNWEGPTRCQ